MKTTLIITSIIPTPYIHPAVGREYLITTSDGNTFKMWAEWFWELDSKWDGDLNNRLGLELTHEWIENYKN